MTYISFISTRFVIICFHNSDSCCLLSFVPRAFYLILPPHEYEGDFSALDNFV